MIAIRVVSTNHVLWGVCLTTLAVPRPFGALEPYFQLLDPFWVGITFIIGGSLPLLALWVRWVKTCLLCAVVPQQVILTYGLVASALDAAFTHDVRVIMALCYLLPWTIWHFKEGIHIAADLWAGGGGSNGRLDG